MKLRPRGTLEFALASIILVTMLARLSVSAVREHRDHRRAVAEARYQQNLRLAMWRLETRVGSMLATVLAPTAMETVGQPFLCSAIDPGSSAVIAADTPDPGSVQRARLAADDAFVAGCSLPPTEFAKAAAAGDPVDFQRRAGASPSVRGLDPSARARNELTVGPLASVWCGPLEGPGVQAPIAPPRAGSSPSELFLARRVERGDEVWHESFRVAWPALRAILLDEVEGLVPSPRLVPIVGGEWEGAAARLASIPVRLESTPVREPGDEAISSGLLWSLSGAWGALLMALVASGAALHASRAFAEKHRRFTHTITHELRTPLTTFRMYSEMLRRGMVPEERRQDYLATLETESTRLSRLVENVLRYAQIEGSGAPGARQTLEVGALLQEFEPELARMTAYAGGDDASISIDVSDAGDRQVETDPIVVQQVLVNLVENACKYARRPGEPLRIRVVTALAGPFVTVDVVDNGPGIPARLRRAAFEPFDRAGRAASDPASGVGLGLALSRSLAREIGGDLDIVAEAHGGHFRLKLPVAASRHRA